ncbi:MAG: cyclic nucleotide-binding domain-containing protein [Magnetococcales bacterium]|nr:cyclic nucleotide-binding domain-containing protein [Magnetococcales bacterium]
MGEQAVDIRQPDRWDNPFDPDMTSAEAQRILELPLIRELDAGAFPESLSLARLVGNETRLIRYQRGDLVVRAGDYGSSAFFVIEGEMAIILPPGLPPEVLGRSEPRRRPLWNILGQLFNGRLVPESRHPVAGEEDRSTGGSVVRRQEGNEVRVCLENLDAILDRHPTVILGAGELFGEIGALGRFPRSVSVVARTAAEILEIRWQGLRDLRRYDAGFRERLNRLYRERSLKAHLRETPICKHLPQDVLNHLEQVVASQVYGEADTSNPFGRTPGLPPNELLAREPLILEEGRPADSVVLVQSGFARISQQFNHGHRTVGFLGRNRIFGLGEVFHRWQQGGKPIGYQYSLRAIGYVQVLRISYEDMINHVLPNLPEEMQAPPFTDRHSAFFEQLDRDDVGLIEFLVEHHFINGTSAMLINMDRCVRCDDCVLACARAHDNNPRFVRSGPRHGSFMVASACMHCIDPVCMIGCPTGAIHRSALKGEVIVNGRTCIGCGTCAGSCPYGAIRMVEVRDESGAFMRDRATGLPVLRATKCDHCLDQWGGPACQRACPHDALLRANMWDTRALRRWMGWK